jgi:hypothetical protein
MVLILMAPWIAYTLFLQCWIALACHILPASQNGMKASLLRVIY